MIVTFRDNKTGKIETSDYPFSIWWWGEGNGSCNCNRQTLFGIEDLDCHTDHNWETNMQRFEAIDVEDHPDKTLQEQLDEFNKDIIEEYKLKTKEEILYFINHGY